MRRSPRVIAAWAIAVIVAVVTIRIVATDLGTLHRRARDLGRDVSVVLVARDVPMGTVIGTADLRTVERPASTVPADALRDTDAAVGRVAGTTLRRDDVVRDAHLAPPDRTGLDGIVPAGRRAVHVVLGDGFRPPLGAPVDVLAAFDAATGARTAATLVARGALVVGVDEADTADGSGPGAASGVTLLVTEPEAASVAYATLTGRVTLALAPPEAACCTSQEASPPASPAVSTAGPTPSPSSSAP